MASETHNCTLHKIKLGWTPKVSRVAPATLVWTTEDKPFHIVFPVAMDVLVVLRERS